MALVVAIIFFAVIGWYAFRLQKERTEEFAAAADGLGFKYLGAISPFGGTDVSGITLLTDTVWHRFRNVLVSKSGGSPVVIPQYACEIYVASMRKEMGAAAQEGPQNHSVIAYRIPHGSVPRFRISSRGTFGNMGTPLDADEFHATSIDLGSKAFADRYVLSAEDETQVRMLFTPFLVKAFVEQPPHTWLHVQVSPDWVFFYDPATLMRQPKNVTPALERVRPIAERILPVR